MRGGSSSGFRRRFQRLFRPWGRVAHVLLTLPPLGPRGGPVRLACLIHAASVHSEPGSNSPSRRSCPGGLAPRALPVRSDSSFDKNQESIEPGRRPVAPRSPCLASLLNSHFFPFSASYCAARFPKSGRPALPPASPLLYTAFPLSQAGGAFFFRGDCPVRPAGRVERQGFTLPRFHTFASQRG